MDYMFDKAMLGDLTPDNVRNLVWLRELGTHTALSASYEKLAVAGKLVNPVLQSLRIIEKLDNPDPDSTPTPVYPTKTDEMTDGDHRALKESVTSGISKLVTGFTQDSGDKPKSYYLEVGSNLFNEMSKDFEKDYKSHSGKEYQDILSLLADPRVTDYRNNTKFEAGLERIGVPLTSYIDNVQKGLADSLNQTVRVTTTRTGETGLSAIISAISGQYALAPSTADPAINRLSAYVDVDVNKYSGKVTFKTKPEFVSETLINEKVSNLNKSYSDQFSKLIKAYSHLKLNSKVNYEEAANHMMNNLNSGLPNVFSPAEGGVIFFGNVQDEKVYEYDPVTQEVR